MTVVVECPWPSCRTLIATEPIEVYHVITCPSCGSILRREPAGESHPLAMRSKYEVVEG